MSTGASGWGAHISECSDGSTPPKVLDDLFGPIDTDTNSRWYLGARRGTNTTREIEGIIQAVLWLKADGGHDAAAILFDSEYAAKIAQSIYKPKSNLAPVLMVQKLVKEETARRGKGLRFIHVRGHSDDDGNDWADELVQWGKEAGPYCRLPLGGETPEEKEEQGSRRREECERRARLEAESATGEVGEAREEGSGVRVYVGDTGLVLFSPSNDGGQDDAQSVTVSLLPQRKTCMQI